MIAILTTTFAVLFVTAKAVVLLDREAVRHPRLPPLVRIPAIGTGIKVADPLPPIPNHVTTRTMVSALVPPPPVHLPIKEAAEAVGNPHPINVLLPVHQPTAARKKLRLCG